MSEPERDPPTAAPDEAGSGADAAVAPYDPGTFWEGRLRGHFDLTGAGFRGIGKPFNQALYRQREIVLERVLKRAHIEASGAQVVELGPGTGFYVDLWRRWGAAGLIGLDITEVATERLAAAYPEFRFEVADVTERWPTPDASADVVTAFDVLFHIVDDDRFAAAIGEAGRVVRPGGHLLISDFFPHRADFRSYHQVSRTLASVASLLDRSGFDVVLRAPVFVTMHPAVDVPSVLAGPARRWWAWLEAALIANPKRGWRLGRVLGAVDRIATRVLPGGPSVEILVARRR